MKDRFPGRHIRDAWKNLKRMFHRREPESPDDPYAMVTAPVKPRPPHRNAAASVDPEY
jgi:hypothetical protein